MSASERAAEEALVWAELAGLSAGLTGPSPAGFELEVTGFDPGPDLARRGGGWGFGFVDGSLGELCRFGAGLAAAEARAWDGDDPVIATRAYEDRRFLLTDRIASWAVPWADVGGRCHPPLRRSLTRVRDGLLDLTEKMRIAPLITGDEGMYPPGEDSYGPFPPRSHDLRLLASGTVLFEATLASLDQAGDLAGDLASLFENAEARWLALAQVFPGSARLWRDLARRARHTSHVIGAGTIDLDMEIRRRRRRWREWNHR